jgi:sulfur carrier protein
MSKIKVNGDEKDVALPMSLGELIKLSGVEQPEMVSVQVNAEFALRDDYDRIVLNEGDEVDFLYFMGGGER